MPSFSRGRSGGPRSHALQSFDDVRVEGRSLIVTAKLNNVDPRDWLADVIARIADHPVKRLDEPLPWNWREQRTEARAAA